MIEFSCNHCGTRLHGADGAAGMAVKCPTCQGDVVIPMASAVAPPPLPGGFQSLPGAAPQPSKTTSIGFMGMATVIAWGITFAAFVISSKGDPSDASKAVVKSIGGVLVLVAAAAVVGLIGAGILAIFKKRFGRSFAVSYSVAALVLAALSGTGMVMAKWNGPARRAKEKQEEAAYLDTTRKQMDELMRAAEKGEAPSPDAFEAPAGQAPETQTGKVGLVLNTYMKDTVAAAAGYDKDLQEIGFMKLLDPVRLSKDVDYQDSHELMEKAHETLAKWRETQEQLAADFPSRLEAAGITGATKREVMEGFKRGYEKTHASSVEIWKLEEESLGHIGDMVKLLEEAKERWHEEEGQFIFDKNADLKVFQDKLAKVAECSARQDALRKQAMGRAKKSLDEAGK